MNNKVCWKETLVNVDVSVLDVINNLNKTGKKIVVFVDLNGRFRGAITDGDLRRGLMSGVSLAEPAINIINTQVITGLEGDSRARQIATMRKHKISQLPVLDGDGMIVDVSFYEELVEERKFKNTVVIMCGGKGTRLLPHTKSCPKPMVPIAGKPMLQHIVEKFKHEGFFNFTFAIHHLGEKIVSYFQDGGEIGVEINYLREPKPLGTAGALSLINDGCDEPLIVTNGDVITNIKYSSMLDFHYRSSADATMAVRTHEWQNPFGIVDTVGNEIVGFREKPVHHFKINAGVYILSRKVLSVLEYGAHLDMPDLFRKLPSLTMKTQAFLAYENWADVGNPADLEKINTEYDNSTSL